jgi:hypothetical protein
MGRGLAFALLLVAGWSAGATSLRAAVRVQLAPVRSCYEAELLRAPRLAGRVLLHLVVDEGRVVWAQIAESTLARPAVERCIEAAVRAWRFDAVGRVLEIRYPIVFRPAEDPDERPALRTEARACWDAARRLRSDEHAFARISWASEPDGFAVVAVEETTLPPAAAECLARAAWRHFGSGTLWLDFLSF